jgi:hypothetical protein
METKAGNRVFAAVCMCIFINNFQVIFFKYNDFCFIFYTFAKIC